MPVFALYNFNYAGAVVDDAPVNGIQNGLYMGGATAAEGDLQLDGAGNFAKIYPAPQFQMAAGTLEITFTPDAAGITAPQTVLSRDSAGAHQGSYRVEILPDGAVTITHETGGTPASFTTGPGFYSPGDTINLSYSWNEGGAGGYLLIDNLTSGATHGDTVPPGLTMDMADQSQPWMIGTDQSDSDPAALNNLDQYFHGTVAFFSLSDSVDNCFQPTADGIVRGTDGADLIDTGYADPWDSDRIDANDARVPGDGPDDDRVVAGAGNDTVLAGAGDDSVWAQDGDDSVSGGAGNDLIYGESGDDTLSGDAGQDTIYGGDGNDVIRGGTDADEFHGGADRDVFVVGSQAEGIGDVIDGGEDGSDHDTLDLSGAGPLTIDYDPANPENGTVTFLDRDGNPTGTLNFINIETVIPPICFTPGTLIATPRGEVPVETLKVGDKVITRDNGIQEIRWLGHKALSGQELRLNAHLRPVLIKAHSLGNGLPEQDMMLSPNHRVLVANDRTQLYFDEHEVLVAAKHLIGSPGVHSVASIGVTYIHFLCDRHEVVLSNGAWTESFQPGDYSLKGLGNSQRSEIYELFPDLKTAAGLGGYQAARRTLKKHEARLLGR